LAGVFAALAGVLALAGSASAQIVDPPPFPPDIVIFPARDFFVYDLAEPNTHYDFRLIRNGVVRGTASGTTDAAGFLEVNHPGGVCWARWTPDVQPGDQIQAIPDPGPPEVGLAAPVPHVHARDCQIADERVAVQKQIMVPLAPGGALFFSALLHHGTPPNDSPLRRWAVQYHYAGESAEPIDEAQHAALYFAGDRYAGCRDEHDLPAGTLYRSTA